MNNIHKRRKVISTNGDKKRNNYTIMYNEYQYEDEEQ